MWLAFWVIVGLLLIVQHVLVCWRAFSIWRSGAETPIQRVARYAVMATALWILLTLLARIFGLL